ncbi:MAG: ABC transporter permease [Clostridiales bacterium]|jgi:ABC-2 type transport system permease protein|nr:ABC transporter permease [Clostridiales bacterium]
MPVFNAYFKVIKKNIVSIMIYFFVFAGMAATFLGVYGAGERKAVFSASKTDVALFAGEDTPLVRGLVESLGSGANIVPLEDSEESIQDALFHKKIDYALRIPAGFSEDFLSGRDEIPLLKTARPLSPGGVSADMLVNQYLNLTRLYLQNVPGITAEEAAENALRDLGRSVDVEMQSSETQIKTVGLAESFRYLAYPILAILLVGITTIMMAFSDTEILRRNMCAPLSPTKMSLQLFLGNAAFAALVWAALCAISVGFYNKAGFSGGVVLLCLNALVFTVFCASAAFLAGKFIRSPIVQAAFTNILTLGICFLSGVFLDQYLLGETVRKIASFMPGFWYIKALNTIKEISVFTFDSVKPVLNDMLIQLAFAAACIVVALVVSKQKKQNMAG